MKRLIDDHVKVLWDAERLGGPTADPGLLESDHLQARKAVNLLAKLLRADATQAPDGTLCWCGDGEVNSYCWNDPGGRSPFCVERSVVLAEVDQ